GPRIGLHPNNADDEGNAREEMNNRRPPHRGPVRPDGFEDVSGVVGARVGHQNPGGPECYCGADQPETARRVLGIGRWPSMCGSAGTLTKRARRGARWSKAPVRVEMGAPGRRHFFYFYFFSSLGSSRILPSGATVTSSSFLFSVTTMIS